MVITITQFSLAQPLTLKEAQQIFLSTAPKYREVNGLIRKDYVVWEGGRTVGGIYVWETRAAAEAMYTEDWRAFVREKYGTDPVVTYLDNPVTVDNLIEKIVAHE